MANGKYTQQTAEQRHELVRQIASALGADWTYRNPSIDGTIAHWAEITHQDGYSLAFTSQYPTYSLHITGNFPRDHCFGYQEKRPSINVDPTKSARMSGSLLKFDGSPNSLVDGLTLSCWSFWNRQYMPRASRQASASPDIRLCVGTFVQRKSGQS